MRSFSAVPRRLLRALDPAQCRHAREKDVVECWARAKKPKKKVEKAARPAARGFGDSAAEAVSADLDAQAVPSAPAEADDAETMAAWRAYAAEAIAAVEKMEAKSDSVLDLLQAEQ